MYQLSATARFLPGQKVPFKWHLSATTKTYQIPALGRKLLLAAPTALPSFLAVSAAALLVAAFEFTVSSNFYFNRTVVSGWLSSIKP
jgi:hypothetical protein